MARYAANCIVYLLDSYDKDFLIVQSAGNGDDWERGVNAKDYNGWFSGIDASVVQDLFNEYKQKGVKLDHQITIQDVMDSFMVVAAVDQKQKKGEYQLSTFSNYGDTVTVCAPGVHVFSTIKSGGLNGSYGYKDGTSMAAPIVSGISALVWSVDQKMSSGEVKQIIIDTATKKVLSRRKNDNGTYYMVDAKAAVEKAVEKFDFREKQLQRNGQFDTSDLPPGAREFNGHYYYIYDIPEVITWDRAQEYCRERNGYLATLTTKEENAFAYSLLSSFNVTGAYFGLRDSGYNDWKWVNNEAFSYSNWAPGEPNSYSEPYGMFYEQYVETWNDGDFGNYTSEDRAFICEWGEYEIDSGQVPETPTQRTTSGERDVVLCLDVSGSMSGNKLEQTKEAAIKFINTVLQEDASIAIVTYSESGGKVSDFSTNAEHLISEVNKIGAGGGTNIEDGLAKSYNLLNYSNAKKQIIVLMSDGEPNIGKCGDSLIEYANSIKDEGVIIYTLGFFGGYSGQSSAQKLMEGIATEGRHYEVDDADKLVFFFGDIADEIKGQEYIFIRIACPVDVRVSRNGETLDSSEDNLSTRTSFGTLSFEENKSDDNEKNSDDRVKVLRLKAGDDYDISIEGTGKGRMNYTIGFMDENGDYNDFRRFTNIKITKNTVIDTVAAKTKTTVLNVDEDGDGKYDLKYRAGANERGEIVDYSYIFYIVAAVIVLIILLIVFLIVKKKIKSRQTKSRKRGS